MKNFRDLQVWHKAHALTIDIYGITASFPKSEIFGLTSQARRASASIAANIAEGCGRQGNSELRRFLQIAAGSASELEYHLILARDLGYTTAVQHDSISEKVIEIKRMLASLLSKIVADQKGIADC